MSWFRKATALSLAGVLLLASCKPKQTRIVDQPELTEELEAVRRLEPEPAAWEEWSAPTSDGHYYAAATGDVNGDGRPDLVAGSFEPGGVAIWTGLADDTWEFSFVSLPSSEGRDVTLADVNDDGRDEILVVSRGGIGGLLLLHAPTDGPWGQPDVISERAGYEAIAAADLDGDGDVDLAAALGGDRVDGGVEIWLGDGAGAFENGYTLQSGGSFKDVLLASIDGDGHLDLIAAGWGLSQGVRIFRGKGDGGFVPGPVLGLPGNYRSVELGDVDGDGRDDVVATTYRNGVRVFPGLDPGAEACVLIESGSFWSALLTDADDDGRAEINVSSTNGLGILSWTHEKECEFTPVAMGLPSGDTWFGLTFGELHVKGGHALIAAGFSDGIRAFGPAGQGDPRAGARSRIVEGPDAAEERWARGNESFTTAQGFAEYRLGVGDLVGVRVFNGESVEEVEAVVQTDGEVFVPARGIGSVPAAGRSPTQLKATVQELASEVWREAEVEVVVLEYRAHKVALLGEIRSTARADSGPGQYAIAGKTRVVEFISKHGGPTDHADLNHVQLIRPDGRSSYLNLYKAVLSSDQRENPIINRGDTVFVPSLSLSNRRLIVLGEVNEPGLLEIRHDITLLEAVARVGGFNDRAYLQNIIVIRGGLEAPEVTAVNIRAALEGGDLSVDLALRSGDIVYVPHKKIVNFQQVMASIQPIFNLILDALIIRELARRP